MQLLLKHGGQLLAAVKQYNIDVKHWLDLSTGINPYVYPVPEIPASVFQRLPEKNDGLEKSAADYYQNKTLLPVAGSQAVIQLLPQLYQQQRVLLPELGYMEHQWHWRKNGHAVCLYRDDEIEKKIQDTDILVIINPNNPSAKRYSVQLLLKWHQYLQGKGGCLIVDEAFMDATPQHSVVSYADQSGLIVLRSIGKFFGLAGIRCGFVFAEQALLDKIESKLGVWAVSNIARYISKKALSDIDWQDNMCRQLQQESMQLEMLLKKTFSLPVTGCSLFKTIMCEDAKIKYQQLAKQAVLVRLLDNQQGLRFGLPKSHQWLTLEKALSLIEMSKTI